MAQKLRSSTRTYLRSLLKTNFMEQPSGARSRNIFCTVSKEGKCLSISKAQGAVLPGTLWLAAPHRSARLPLSRSEMMITFHSKSFSGCFSAAAAAAAATPLARSLAPFPNKWIFVRSIEEGGSRRRNTASSCTMHGGQWRRNKTQVG